MDQMTARGHVDAFVVGEDGSRRQVVAGHNTLLYWCADAVAHMFAGMVDYVPTTIGFVYSKDQSSDLSSKFIITSDPRETRGQSDIVTGGLSVLDVQIGQNKQFSSGDADKYSGNRVTFGAMTTNNTEAADIYGILLKDSSGRVIAVKKFDSKVSRAANYALAVSWAVTFS